MTCMPSPQLTLGLEALLNEARAEAFAEVCEDEGVDLPKTRAECEGPGLCPKLSCRYNFTLEVTPAGSIRLNGAKGVRSSVLMAWDGYGRKSPREHAFRERSTHRKLNDAEIDRFDDAVLARLDEMDCNCVLDVIARHPDGMGLDEIASALGLNTRQVVEQVEKRALDKLNEGMRVHQTGQEPKV